MSVLTKSQLVFSETGEVERKIAKLNLTGAPHPLQLGSSLESFKKTDVTPQIGTEFERGFQLSDLLNAPNVNDLIRDLAILGIGIYLLFFSQLLLTLGWCSLTTRSSILSRSEYHD